MDWKKLIAGGFSFGTAPFASHPKDEERATEMILLAQAQGAALDEVIDECRKYLENAKGWPTNIKEQLKHVMRFALEHGYSKEVILH